MGNLQNLIQKIIEDGQNEADAIIQDAERKKEEIIQRKVSEAEEAVERVIAQANREGELVKDRLISNANIQARDARLKAKRDVIQRAFTLAKERLDRLDEEEYLQFLQNHLKDVQLTGKEELVVPEDKKNAVKALPLPINVSERESVDSGFLLKSDQFIMNHSFDFLLDYNRDELELEIARILFNEQE